jgi:hypothetical protein
MGQSGSALRIRIGAMKPRVLELVIFLAWRISAAILRATRSDAGAVESRACCTTSTET